MIRPPATAPKFLVLFVGTGAQLLVMTVGMLCMGLQGSLSPAIPGRLHTAQLFWYSMGGLVGGYSSTRLYECFGGNKKDWGPHALRMAHFFPFVANVAYCFINFIALGQRSTYVMPFRVTGYLLMLWLGLSTPMVYLGNMIARGQSAIGFVPDTTAIDNNNSSSDALSDRSSPHQVPFWLSPPCSIAMAGAVPYFGAISFEFRNLLMPSLWNNDLFHDYVYLAKTMVLFVLLVQFMTLLLHVKLLCHHQYDTWWWRSFVHGGASALWMWGNSLTYYMHMYLWTASFGTFLIYFVYMTVLSFSVFLTLGFVGLSTIYLFHHLAVACSFPIPSPTASQNNNTHDLEMSEADSPLLQTSSSNANDASSSVEESHPKSNLVDTISSDSPTDTPALSPP